MITVTLYALSDTTNIRCWDKRYRTEYSRTKYTEQDKIYAVETYLHKIYRTKDTGTKYTGQYIPNKIYWTTHTGQNMLNKIHPDKTYPDKIYQTIYIRSKMYPNKINQTKYTSNSSNIVLVGFAT